jgi:predicted GIY-YIG superfamily endonuclease
MKIEQVTDVLQKKQGVYIIPCERGRCYIGKTSGQLEAYLMKHKHDLTECVLKK